MSCCLVVLLSCCLVVLFSCFLVLLFVIRPLNIFTGTVNSKLTIKQKILLAWIAPRGIVAAAVASYFAIELEKHGIDGSQLRAMVFLLIAITVLSAGLTGGFVAKLLGLKRQSEYGWVILDADAEVDEELEKTCPRGHDDVDCECKNCKIGRAHV